MSLVSGGVRLRLHPAGPTALYPRNWPFAVLFLPLGPLALHHSGRRRRSGEGRRECATHVRPSRLSGRATEPERRGVGTEGGGTGEFIEGESEGAEAGGPRAQPVAVGRSLAQSLSSPASNAVHEHVKLSNDRI